METDPTKLTSFQALSPVPSPSGFSIAKLFSFSRINKATKSGLQEITSDGTSTSGIGQDSASHGRSCSSVKFIY